MMELLFSVCIITATNTYFSCKTCVHHPDHVTMYYLCCIFCYLDQPCGEPCQGTYDSWDRLHLRTFTSFSLTSPCSTWMESSTYKTTTYKKNISGSNRTRIICPAQHPLNVCAGYALTQQLQNGHVENSFFIFTSAVF